MSFRIFNLFRWPLWTLLAKFQVPLICHIQLWDVALKAKVTCITDWHLCYKYFYVPLKWWRWILDTLQECIHWIMITVQHTVAWIMMVSLEFQELTRRQIRTLFWPFKPMQNMHIGRMWTRNYIIYHIHITRTQVLSERNCIQQWKWEQHTKLLCCKTASSVIVKWSLIGMSGPIRCIFCKKTLLGAEVGRTLWQVGLTTWVS